MWTKEQKLSIKLIMSTLESVPYVDKANTWLLAGAGATATIIISNLDTIVHATNSYVPTLILLSLAISSLLGFLAKIIGVRAEACKALINIMLSALEDEKDTDINECLENYISAVPWSHRWLARRGALKGNIDPLFGFKKAAGFAFYQGFYTMWQALAFIALIVIAATGLK